MASPLAFTSAEVLTFRTLQDISDFVRIPDPVFKAFLNATGAEGDVMPRVFGVMPISDFNDIVASLKITTGEGEEKVERAPNFTEKGKLALLARACHQCATLGGTPISPPEAGSSLGVPAPPSLAVKKVKLSEVLRQGADLEISVQPESLMTAGEGRLRVLYGMNYEVPHNIAVTREQLSAVHYLLEVKDIPYLDFAIWGPHGHRTARKLRLIGQVFDSNGTLRTIEIAGPPNLEVWLDCYAVMTTAFLMLDIMDLGTLSNYGKLIQDFYHRYGPNTWLLLYQAETRFRQEQVDRCRRKAATLHERARIAGGTTEFEPLRPWNYAYQFGTTDADGLGSWWYKEFTEAAVSILTTTNNLHAFLGGDAPVSDTGRAITEAVSSAAPNRVAKRPQPPINSAPATLAPPVKKKSRGEKKSVVAVNGVFQTNRSGTPLCSSFQTGMCSDAHNGRCPSDPNKAHQCNLCLSRDHGANICTSSKKATSSSSKGGGKKNRGKGKKQW